MKNDVCRREKCIGVTRGYKDGLQPECIEKENVCFEEARRESIKENERKAVDMSQDVPKLPKYAHATGVY
jgi:hypothetical protein